MKASEVLMEARVLLAAEPWMGAWSSVGEVLRRTDRRADACDPGAVTYPYMSTAAYSAVEDYDGGGVHEYVLDIATSMAFSDEAAE